MNPLFLIRVPVAMNHLARCAGERGWLRHRGSVAGFDEGRALHHLLDETFGPGALRPFRLLVAARQAVGNLYSYCETDGESLREGGSSACPTRAPERAQARSARRAKRCRVHGRRVGGSGSTCG